MSRPAGRTTIITAKAIFQPDQGRSPWRQNVAISALLGTTFAPSALAN